MKLAGLSNLAITTKGSGTLVKMGECQSKGVVVKNLRNTGLQWHSLLLITPVTSSEGVFESIGDSTWLHSLANSKLFVCFLKCTRNSGSLHIWLTITIRGMWYVMEESHITVTICPEGTTIQLSFTDENIRHSTWKHPLLPSQYWLPPRIWLAGQHYPIWVNL